MAVYLVERDMPGVTMEELAAAQKTAIQMGKELTAENKCMCLFEADNPDHVREANERGKIPFSRIVPAEDLTPKND